MLSTLGDRDLLLVVAVVLMIVALILGRRALTPRPRSRASRHPTPSCSRGSSAPSSCSSRSIRCGAPTCPSSSLRSPSWPPGTARATKILVVALVVALPYHVVHAWPMLRPTGFTGSAERVVEQLEALPEGALAISDDPGIVWRAGRLHHARPRRRVHPAHPDR